MYLEHYSPIQTNVRICTGNGNHCTYYVRGLATGWW